MANEEPIEERSWAALNNETPEETTVEAEAKLTGGRLASQRLSMESWLMLDSITILFDAFYPLRQPFLVVQEYLKLDFDVIHIDTQLAKDNVWISHTFRKISGLLADYSQPVVKSYHMDPKGFDGMRLKEINSLGTLPVLIDERFYPKVTVVTESHQICNYLATVKPVSYGGLLQANTLIPQENSIARREYELLVSWEKMHFGPKAAPVVEKLVRLRKNRYRKYIASRDRRFHETDWPLLKDVLTHMENVILAPVGPRTPNGRVPVFLCGVGIPQPLSIYCTEIC
jgi:glutathione S-transferase